MNGEPDPAQPRLDGSDGEWEDTGEPEPAQPNKAEQERAHHFYIRGKDDLNTALDGLGYLMEELDNELQRTEMSLVQSALRDEHRRALHMYNDIKATLKDMEL